MSDQPPRPPDAVVRPADLARWDEMTEAERDEAARALGDSIAEQLGIEST